MMSNSFRCFLFLLALTPQVSAFSSFGTAPSKPSFVAASSSSRRSIQQQSRLTSFTELSMSSLASLPDDFPDDAAAAEKSQSTSSSSRQQQKGEQDAGTFLSGDDSHQLRRQVLGLQEELHEARRLQDTPQVARLERAIVSAQHVNAEFMYTVSTERMLVAQAAGKHEQAEVFRNEADLARSALPQFNLSGLWVGKYGEQGFEMINVTYTGDTLVAYKVTGDRNVPKGQASFTVDLSPTALRMSSSSSQDTDVLEPIELASDAAEQWGSKFLQRFSGNGHVSSEGFVNSQWIDGQLILVGPEYFSFAWLPIGHQVFFGRPSPELTLKLMRQKGTQSPANKNSDDSKIREHLLRCMEETELLDDEMEVSDGLFSSHNQDVYYTKEGCFE
jgi:hypothetical protein